MATKTVLKALLSKWGILSIDMQSATTKDETVRDLVNGEEGLEDKEVIDVEPGEIKDIDEQKSKEEKSEQKIIDASDLPEDSEMPF